MCDVLVVLHVYNMYITHISDAYVLQLFFSIQVVNV